MLAMARQIGNLYVARWRNVYAGGGATLLILVQIQAGPPNRISDPAASLGG